MGKIVEKVIVKNHVDIANAAQGIIPKDAIRSAEVEAVVDTGAAMLCLPPDVVVELGLLFSHSRNVRTANGSVKRRIFGGASITIQGRESQMAVMENDQTTPPLIGYLIMEDLDLVPNPKTQRLTPNPEHDGKWLTDLF
ncbi:MAG: hypothetical protein B6244_01810 [Candidatus Cloacimonetes bacterium 4572_55]|nr:MAG: hypothetical protein B6244_01810 [Candidatus Cloacimonetes bacterium 4572_55]